MTIFNIILIFVAVVLGIAYYFQRKASHKQAEEQEQLLADYQRRVDEQQKLLDDYRALEKNFDNIGEGYEQALMAFDQMEEEKQKQQTIQQQLEQRCATLQQQCDELTKTNQQQAEAIAALQADIEQAAKAGGAEVGKLAGRASDLTDIDSQLPPIDRTDNIMVSVVADEAVKQSGIDKVQYLKFETVTAPDAAYTMLMTNQQKAVRALTHLLDNAQKFTTEGTVKLSVAVNMDKMQAIYTVEDTGSGIEAADAERIFEPYVKLNQYFDGKGIGLTVARNIARRLGGDVVLDTQYAGPGARFVLTLPI